MVQLKVAGLCFFGDQGSKSIVFKEGTILDFSHVGKARDECQFRPTNKLWLTKSIYF